MLRRDAHGAEFNEWPGGTGTEAVRVDPATDPSTAFQYLDAVSELFQLVRRHETGYTGTDDGNPLPITLDELLRV
jgi:hypothetical protein